MGEHKDNGGGALISTHSLKHLEEVMTHFYIISEGRVSEKFDKAEILKQFESVSQAVDKFSEHGLVRDI